MITITSQQNERLKAVERLSKRAEREARQVTVVEGMREVSRAVAAGVRVEELYLCPEAASEPEFPALLALAERCEAAGAFAARVSSQAFARIAYREGTAAVVAVVPYFARPLAELVLPTKALVVVIDGGEKPGNVGAILRTADAAGADAVIVCGGGTDLHNPNVIRASLGTVFSVPVAEGEVSEVVTFLRAHDVRVVAADPAAGSLYWETDLTGPVAVCLGGEAHGLSAEIRAAADTLVRIPMAGVADSLNLSSAAAILLYEARRQRTRSSEGRP